VQVATSGDAADPYAVPPVLKEEGEEEQQGGRRSLAGMGRNSARGPRTSRSGHMSMSGGSQGKHTSKWMLVFMSMLAWLLTVFRTIRILHTPCIMHHDSCAAL
jgi:hypothetical protein